MSNITLGAYLSKIKTNRAAVLPYVIKDFKVYFLVAVDSKTGEITDLGGGVKKNECSIVAAIREFKEETKEIFEGIYNQINNMATNVAIVCNQMCVIFLPLEQIWLDTAVQKFKMKKSHKKICNEISDLLWVEQDDFVNMLDGKSQKMWNRIRYFYKNNYDENLIEALKLTYILR
jgi:hypothetical protein